MRFPAPARRVLSWLVFFKLNVDSQVLVILTACDFHNPRKQNKSVMIHLRSEFLCKVVGDIAKLLSESRFIWNIGVDDSSHLDRVRVSRKVWLTDQEQRVPRMAPLPDYLLSIGPIGIFKGDPSNLR